MNTGAHAIGAMGLNTSIIGVMNVLSVFENPSMSPNGMATTKAIAKPWMNNVRLDLI